MPKKFLLLPIRPDGTEFKIDLSGTFIRSTKSEMGALPKFTLVLPIPGASISSTNPGSKTVACLELIGNDELDIAGPLVAKFVSDVNGLQVEMFLEGGKVPSDSAGGPSIKKEKKKY